MVNELPCMFAIVRSAASKDCDETRGYQLGSRSNQCLLLMIVKMLLAFRSADRCCRNPIFSFTTFDYLLPGDLKPMSGE